MITSFKIENFKVHKNIKVSNLTQVNLIGGCNNVGKTTLLEALFNYFDHLSPEIFIRQFSWRGVISMAVKQQNLYELWSPVFNNYDITKKIRILITKDKVHDHELIVEIEQEPASSVPRTNIQVIPEVSTGGTDTGLQYVLHLLSKTGSEKVFETYIRFGKTGIETKRRVQKHQNLGPAHFFNSRTLSAKEDALRFGELVRDGKENLIVEALREFEPKISSISSVPMPDNISILFADAGLSKRVPINYLGDGLTRLLSYILAIITSKNGIIFIDEIENGFHYTKHKMVWSTLLKLAKEYDVQIIATTHSFEMARAYNEVANDLGKDYSYYELFRSPNTNEVMVNHLDSETLGYKLKANKPFRGEIL